MAKAKAKRWPANRPRRLSTQAQGVRRAISPHEVLPGTDSCSDGDGDGDGDGDMDKELSLHGSSCCSAVPPSSPSSAPPIGPPDAAVVEDATLLSLATPDALQEQEQPVESLQVLTPDGEGAIPVLLEELDEKKSKRGTRLMPLVSPLINALREDNGTARESSAPERPPETKPEHDVQMRDACAGEDSSAVVIINSASQSEVVETPASAQRAKTQLADAVTVLTPLPVLEPLQDDTAEESVPDVQSSTHEETEAQAEEQSEQQVQDLSKHETRTEANAETTQEPEAQAKQEMAVIPTALSHPRASLASRTSSGCSSSSRGEAPALSQKTVALHQHKLRSRKPRHEELPGDSLPEDSATDASTPSVRRSTRKRRAVDVLRPSENTPVSTRKRRATSAAKVSSIKKALCARPAAAAVAAARAEAAVKEEGTKMAASPSARESRRLRKKSPGVPRPKASSAKGKSPQGLLSPMQDEQKKTPRKSKLRKKSRRSLEATFGHETTDYEAQMVKELIAELYEEQEKDDRSMYNITTQMVRAETSACTRSQEVEELSLEEFRRLMTYGEVSVESVSSTILPFLRLEKSDIFFDLGCGTGKILVQAALQTPCETAVGLELMQNRVNEGRKALERLKARDLEVLRGKRVEVLQGDICAPPDEARLMDATVVFINNVMFGPTLMLKVLELLQGMPKLKRVVTLRKICERHGQAKCARAQNYCVQYVHPPQEAEIHVSWASKTSVYLYESLDYSVSMLTQLLGQSASASASATAAAAAVPPRPTPSDKPRKSGRKHHAPASLAAKMEVAAHE